MTAQPIATVDIELNHAQLLEAVRQQSGLEIARTTLYRWRQRLNILEPPYTMGHVLALAKYGQQMKLGVSHATAKARKTEYLEQLGD